MTVKQLIEKLKTEERAATMKSKRWHSPTLSEVLDNANLSSVCEDFGRLRVFNRVGEVFEGSDDEVWQWLRVEDYHYSDCRECTRNHTEAELDIHGVCEECAAGKERFVTRERAREDADARGDYVRDQQKDGEL